MLDPRRLGRIVSFALVAASAVLVPASSEAVLCKDWYARVRIREASTPPKAIQVLLDYSNSGGGFLGIGGEVHCASETGYFASFDSDEDKTLRLAVINLADDFVPGVLGTCRFRLYSDATPTADLLPLTIEDASDANFDPVTLTTKVGFLPASELHECGERCGDGILDEVYEQCDDHNTHDGDSCSSNCMLPACGNGVVDPPEQCDDGNKDEGDDCLSTCRTASCGDHWVHHGVEECDDGNSSNQDSCSTGCELALCGDGTVQAAVEECDDGNGVSSDDCTNQCRYAMCGDGYVHEGVEQCDDGNQSSSDDCTRYCVPARCGDGFRHFDTEECDDANSNDQDACISDCRTAKCGDGLVYEGFEGCDDGNRLDGDDCGATCEVPQRCGDAIPDGYWKTGDALRVLQAAVGLDVECARWACQVTSTGSSIVTSDALTVLKQSVGLSVVLACREPSHLQFILSTSVNVASLVFDVDPSAASAKLTGEGDALECESLVYGATMSFQALEGSILRVTANLPGGFGARKAIARCRMTPTGPVHPWNFPVDIIGALSPTGVALEGVATVRAVPY